MAKVEIVERLERLERLERMERLERLERMERMERMGAYGEACVPRTAVVDAAVCIGYVSAHATAPGDAVEAAAATCMYVWFAHSRIHKGIGTSDNRDRLYPQRRMLVQAVVTVQLCYHTRQLSQRQQTSNQTNGVLKRT